ncbi:unannotated protein [freshwater metagenome]|uniref:Unannotated protein n=1 Tax=freshwater metagenome TaxID=449393 RepID=A0A6J7I7C6_9ZZZZ
MGGGVEPERDADRERDEQRPERQFQCGSTVDEQDVTDRAIVGGGAAEVAAQQSGQVLPVLRQDRPVVSGLGLALGDLFGG